jgi:hypothetical protein
MVVGLFHQDEAGRGRGGVGTEDGDRFVIGCEEKRSVELRVKKEESARLAPVVAA